MISSLKKLEFTVVVFMVGLTASVLSAGIPQPVRTAFQEYKPWVSQMELVSEVDTAGANYYILWGAATPSDGSKPDSDGVEEATYRLDTNTGKVDRINGDRPVIPAENYISDPALAQQIDDNYVSKRIESLGGVGGAQKYLNEKSFMSKLEAMAWVRAGYRINPDTKIYQGDGNPPYQRAGDVIPATGK